MIETTLDLQTFKPWTVNTPSIVLPSYADLTEAFQHLQTDNGWTYDQTDQYKRDLLGGAFYLSAFLSMAGGMVSFQIEPNNRTYIMLLGYGYRPDGTFAYNGGVILRSDGSVSTHT